MADKRFKNSSIISGAQTQKVDKAPQAETGGSFFPIRKKKTLFTPPADQEDLVKEIQSLRVSKKKLKEEIEDLRKLKKREDRKAASTSGKTETSYLSGQQIKNIGIAAILLLIVGGAAFFVRPTATVNITPMVQLGLDAFSNEEKQELAGLFRQKQLEYRQEYDAIEQKLLRNQESLDQNSQIVRDGLDMLKNQVFVEYQGQLGIMELQQVLFERNAPDVAEDLGRGISQIKNEIIVQLKSKIAGAEQSAAQEHIAQLANLLFLKSRKNAIEIMETTANLYNK